MKETANLTGLRGKILDSFLLSWTRFHGYTAMLALACMTASQLAAAQSQPTADLLITHGRVYTVNAKQPWAEAVAIRGDKIVAVGSAAEIDHYRGAATKEIDAGGNLVLPGFTDCHIHFLSGSLSLQRIYLDDAPDIAEIQRRVKAYADTHPKQPWVLGRGWQYSSVGSTNLPDKKYLDEIVSDRPVYLESYDGHTWWANTKAMQLAGINKDTPNPPGGEIVRDPRTGEATGVFKEDPADELSGYKRYGLPDETIEFRLWDGTAVKV